MAFQDMSALLPPTGPTPTTDTSSTPAPATTGTPAPSTPAPSTPAPSGFVDMSAFLMKPVVPQPKGVLNNMVSAAVSGVADSLHALNQSARTMLGANPDAATPPAPDYEQNYTGGDFLHPLDELIPKAIYQISNGAPVLAAGILGGIAGSKVGPTGAVVGGSLAAGTMAAVRTLGPAYAAALKANPKDPNGAFDSALKTAGESGAFSAAGWALFSWTPFKDAARDILAKTAGTPGLGPR